MKSGTLLLMTLLMLTLTACSSSNSGSNDEPASPEPPSDVGGTPSVSNGVSGFASQSADSDPLPIADLEQLQSDLGTLFGSADGSPVVILDGETANDVIQRQSDS